MDATDILIDGFTRVRDLIRRIGGGVDDEALVYRPDAEANTIAWLLWHTSRVIDAQVNEMAEREQVWTADGWARLFALPFEESVTGYGQTPAEVGEVRVGSDLLVGYHEAVHASVVSYVSDVDAAELDRVIDTRWDPPVTVGVRLVSCIGDGLQHVGQAGYVLGLAERRQPG